MNKQTFSELSISDAFQMAMAHHQRGELSQAEALYRHILQQEPNHADALHFLGVLAHQVEQHEAAVSLINQAIGVCADSSPMYCNLGLALQALGKLDAAVASYRQALLLRPDYAQAYYNLGNALQVQGKLDEAFENYQQALSLNPDFAIAHNNLGNVFKQQNNLDAAITSYRAALAAKPDYVEAHNNLGIALQAQGKFELAIISYRAALAFNPENAEVYTNMGSAFEIQGQYDAALESYQKALALKQDYSEARYTVRLLMLSLGQFKDGWKYCEARYHMGIKNRNTFAPNFNFPQWQGESIVGKSLVIYCEQGLGDEIQFCRYVSVLKSQGDGYITWICRKSLKALIKTLKAVDSVVTQEELTLIAPHDYWTFALSTPLHCRTTLDSIPATVPYLCANPEQVKIIAASLTPITEFKVGICWQGNPAHKNDVNRSPGIAAFKSLFKIPGVKFFTLQPGTREEFIDAAGQSAVDRGHEIDQSSFEEAAALIMNLDLVISCDTSICHLAGALGKPVWIVLPFRADWRWLIDRDDSPWYPNMRLFRQSQQGSWSEVFQHLENRLTELITGEG
ncbi:MAG: tetratricopeptide repeat protein [Chlorobiales bacterium]|nr:tetratricopeptide repeat protein [Chlorobiales bacterium]